MTTYIILAVWQLGCDDSIL